MDVNTLSSQPFHFGLWIDAGRDAANPVHRMVTLTPITGSGVWKPHKEHLATKDSSRNKTRSFFPGRINLGLEGKVTIYDLLGAGDCSLWVGTWGVGGTRHRILSENSQILSSSSSSLLLLSSLGFQVLPQTSIDRSLSSQSDTFNPSSDP